MIVKNIKYNVIATLLYFFRQMIYYLNISQGYFLVGNLDAFFILAPIYIIKNIKKIKKETIIFIVVCIVYLFIQIFFIPELDIVRACINLAKIIVCYFVMQYIIQYYNKIDFKFICKMFSILCIIFLVISLIAPDGILWRHNDTINKYDLDRLQFLYTEPSELGLHSILIILLLFYMLIESKNIKQMTVNILLMIPIFITLFLARPLGAIGIGAIAIGILCIMDLIYNYSKRKLGFYLILLVIAVFIMGYMIVSQNSLYLRVIDTFNKKDLSNNYRMFVPFYVSRQVIIDTNAIGIGFGNLELENNVEKYKDLGLERAGIVSSYMNVISESGILGIIIVSTIMAAILKKSFEEKSSIKIALSVFIIVYQFVGTHFTNPLCWVIYGIILSNLDFKDILKNDCNKE